MDAIHITNLRFSYPATIPGGSPVKALCGVDLTVSSGEFLALMGPVGSGKTTLCLALNGAIPHVVDGDMEGQVSVLGRDTRATAMGHLAMQAGLVFENTETQLFSATAADEIAFGLEAAGLPPGEIEQRIDDALDVVNLAGFRQRNPRTLSGGEQKRLALACVLAMRPRLLILDEPTAGLDNSGRYRVLAAVDRLRQAWGGMTVIMATQDAEAAARFADRVVVLQQGRVALSGSPEHVFSQVDQIDAWGLDMPQLARLAHRLQRPIVFAPDDAIRLWADLPRPDQRPHHTLPNPKPPARPTIEVRSLSHAYPDAARPALYDVTMDVLKGEWLAVIGVNGSGKSTLLKHLNGLLHPTSGTVRVGGHDSRTRQVGELADTVSYLPQNPDHSIFCATVSDEVAYGPRQLGLKGSELDARVEETLRGLQLTEMAHHPPAVLGYGLRRQVALASVLSMRAPVLALDEPTTGLDRGTIVRLMDIVSQRHLQGTTVIMISHDLQLVARYAQRVIVLHQGSMVATGDTQEILSDIGLIRSSGLEPLPVTLLARALDWPSPLPLRADDWGPHA
jgi:energy-coupling factor transport system ATP-binding protein